MLAYISNILNHEIIEYVRDLNIEKLFVFYLKQRSSKVGDYEVCGFAEIGSGDAHIIHPDTVSYKTMKQRYDELEADALVIMHNHPKLKGKSSVSPSDYDLIGTYAIAKVCLKNNMKLLDHIIIDSSGYFSFVENQLIDI